MKPSKSQISIRAAKRLGSRLLLWYGTVVFLLVTVICIGGSLVLIRLANREVDRLAATTTLVISDAIERVSFSGKYHARLLVDDLVRKHSDIAYIAIHDRKGVVFAHSDPSLNDTQPYDPAAREAMRVLDGGVQIIQRLLIDGQRIEEVDVPLVGGYANELLGVVRVGISREDSFRELMKGLSLIAALGLLLIVVSLAIVHRISRRLAAPVTEMALTLQGIFDHAPIGVVIQGRGGRILHGNNAVGELLDTTPSHERGRYLYDLTEAVGLDALARVTERVFETAKSHEQEIELISDVGTRTISIIGFPVATDRMGRTSEVCAFLVDLSRTKALEEQLRSAHRMEGLGELAGGIAHDLNNLLTGILEHADLAFAEAPAGTELRENLQEILEVADRGAGLAESLASFGRDRSIEAIPLDLAERVSELVPMLSHVVGEGIRLDIVPPKAQEVVVKAAPAQLAQVLLNLATNAADAMPEGGTITISISEAPANRPTPGSDRALSVVEWGSVVVSDTGVGMGRAVLEKAFEPLFTTKSPGEGAGLGLSTAYGIVKQHGGEIELESRVGEGTSVRVLLPIAHRTAESSDQALPEVGPVAGGDETILLAEDAPSVRRLLVKILELRGYGVVAVEDGASAASLFARERDDIDLVLLDVVMPGMGGREALAEIRRLDPDMPAILMSGYPSEKVQAGGPLGKWVDYLAKPVKTDALLRMVRTMLDRAQGSRSRDGEVKADQK